MDTLLSMPHPVFDLGEQLFDRIEVGAIARQEDPRKIKCAPRARTAALAPLPFVRTEIVEHHDIAWRERGCEELLDLGREEHAVARPVDRARCVNPIMAQRRPILLRCPRPRIGSTPSTPLSKATVARHNCIARVSFPIWSCAGTYCAARRKRPALSAKHDDQAKEHKQRNAARWNRHGRYGAC